MNRIIKIILILISLILLIVLCVLFLKYTNANNEATNTPVTIFKPLKKKEPLPSKEIDPPLTRDENDIPKSDYKVPEIG